jgi:hypothetical protein
MSVLDVTYLAEEDLTASQYRAVVHGANDNGMALPAGGNAGRGLGILQTDPDDGEQGAVRKEGISLAIASGNIARGDPLEIANAAGALKSGVAGTGTYYGTAEEDAENGDTFRAFLTLVEFTGSSFAFSSSSSSSSCSSSSSST